MKNFLKQFGKAICYFLLYFGMQMIVCIGYIMVYIVEKSFEVAGQMQATSDMGMAAGDMAAEVEAITLGAINYLLQSQNEVVIISGILSLLVLWLFFKLRKKNLLAEVKLTKVSATYGIIAVGLGVGMMLTINFGLSLLPESWLLAYAEQSGMITGGSTIAVIISTMIMAPLIEEIIFRGLIVSRLKKAVPGTVAVLLTALVFGLAHGQILWMTYTFVLGVVLGLVAVKTDSIIPGIIMHMVFNVCGVVIPTLLGEVVSTGLCVIMVIVGVIITSAFLLWLFKLDRKEKEVTQAA